MTYIRRLEIIAFGKFENYTLELEQGYNEIILPNESGKSTITDFILFMLYGFVKTTKKTVALEDNLLLKYLPWSDMGSISGGMVISKDGEEYRIERRHQKSRQTSSTVIRDSTGRELPVTVEPGEYFLGVDRDTFLRTFLIRQTDIKFKSTDGIVTALKNLVTTGDEDMSFEEAKTALEDEKKKYHHIGRRSGRIYDIQKEIAGLQSDIYNLERTLSLLQSNSYELESLKADIEKLGAKLKNLENTRPQALAYDAALKLESLAKTEQEYRKLKSQLENDTTHNLTDNDFSNAAEVYSKRDALQNRGDELKTEKQQLETKLDTLLDELPDYEYIKQNETELIAKVNDKGKPNPAFIISGAVATVAGILTAVMVTPLLWILSVIGIVVTALGFVLKKKAPVDSNLLNQLTLYNERKTEIELTKALIGTANGKLAEFEREETLNRGKCEMIQASLGVTNAKELATLLAARNNIGIIKSRMAELETKRSELLANDSIETLKEQANHGGQCAYGIQQLERMITATAGQKAELTSRAAALAQDFERSVGLQRDIQQKQGQISVLTEELESAKYKTLVLDTALEAMQQAYDKINKMFSPKLTEKCKTPLSTITNGKYSEVFLDRDFVIRIKADGELKELGYFSRGTADAVYFAVRQAVSELIANGNSVPLVMDDPFWSLDDNRLENAVQYIKKLATDSQVIVFAARK